jgi:hypothetical protein
MTTLRTASRFSRAAALLSIPALAFAISITSADAQPGNANRNGHGNGHGSAHNNGHGNRSAHGNGYGNGYRHGNIYGYGGGYRYGGGYGYGHNHVAHVAPGCAPYVAYAPYYGYPPYPAYSPYAACAPYPAHGTVGYGPVRGVNGFIGFAGPNFSIGVGF